MTPQRAKAVFESFRTKWGVTVSQASGWEAVCLHREDWEVMAAHFGADTVTALMTKGRLSLVGVGWDDYATMAKGEPLIIDNVRWVVNQPKPFSVGNGVNKTNIAYYLLCIAGGRQ